MPDSLGVRHNNYLNVKNASGDPWKDDGGKLSTTDERGHAVFANPAYGLRAGILLLRKYFFGHNLRSVAEILSRWAPTSDTVGSLPGAPANSPKEYAAFVAARMHVSPTARLDIFDADQTLGNLSKLRDLVFAMASYENGNGFEVPVHHWNAALEIVQPGVLAEGTATAPAAASATPEMLQIGASVGKASGGAVNNENDVETVQEMLRNVSMILRDARLDPGPVDGSIAASGSSATVRSIETFQARFLAQPDGVVSPGGRTWRELLAIIDGPPAPAVAAGGAKYFFPLPKRPSQNWSASPRCYASSRSGGARAHAGCDLYAPAGTVVHAIADGVVVRGPYDFYAKTFALEIDHGDFLARYGEIQAETTVRKGDKVVAGQAIGRVGHLVGIRVPSDMLHLELYSKKAAGPLTVARSESALTSAGVPFLRRRDLIDPGPQLNAWIESLPA